MPRTSLAPSAHPRSRAFAGRLAAVASAVALVASGTGLTALPAMAAPDAAPAATDYTSFVNPFVSTAGDDGNDLPGAQAPNGLAKVNPLTTPNRNHTGYDYNEKKIAGFTQTNLDGVGGSGGGGDILVVPTEVGYSARPSTGSYAHPYSHSDEAATPGYYRVGLGEIAGTDGAVTAPGGTINAEVAAATRTAMHRYTFPAGKTPSLVFDLNNNFTSRTGSSITTTTLADGRIALSGTFAGNFNGASYAMSYYAETAQKVASVRTWADGSALDTTANRTGTDTGAVITFDPAAGSQVELRITLSPISAAQAQTDQANEVGGKNFDQVRAETAAAWNARLGAVDVTASTKSDPDGTLKKLFYTHLYRMFAVPTNATSTSGTYRGVDGAVHQVDDYTYYDGWSSWDDFRKYSVIAYVDPTLYRDMIQSLITLFADQNASGAANLASLVQGVPTVRWERSAVIVADALSKGYTGFTRLDEAYPTLHNLVGYYSGQELRQGYIADRPGSSLERGYDQWALAIIADALGKTDEAKDLRAQAALPFQNVFKAGAWTAADGTQVGLLTPRNAAGDWTSVDYERFETANLYQGTPWQYNWYGAYDMAGTIQAMGGSKAAKLGIEHMFGEDSATDDGKGMLHSNANEIDLQAPYLFNYVGEPSLTQKWARAIYTKPTWNRYIATGSTNEAPSGNGEFTPPVKTNVYKLSPAGFLPTMDNDAGTMSTMFVAAAIGLFPVTAGSSQYQIGSPFFDSTKITYDTGRSFTVSAGNVSSDNFYIQSATLGGAAYNNTWVDYSSIVGGGTLAFDMGAKATSWGADTKPAYSMSTGSTGTPGNPGGGDGGSAKTYPVTASATSLAAAADGTVSGSIVLTLGGGATFTGAVGSSITGAGGATVSGLPASVTADLRVTTATTATLRLSGTLTKNARFHVNFADAALGGGATAATLTGQGVSDLSALELTVSNADRVALQKLVDQAALVQPGNYSFASYSALTKALTSAQKVLADASATSSKLRSATSVLQAAIDGLGLDQGAYRVLQAEQSDEWSGGSLKNEAYQSTGDLGGVTTGSWVRYNNLDFAGSTPKRIAIRYANSQAANAAPSTATVHAGDENGPVVGTVSLPGTGSWGNYVTVSAAVTDPVALAAAKRVTFTFTAPAGQAWVSNFDWFQFSATASDGAAPVVVEAEAWKTNSGGGLKSEQSTWSDGAVTDLGATYDKAWLDYGTIDFGTTPISEVAIHYVNNSSRCGANSSVDVYLDGYDPANPGTPYANVPLAVTGSDWVKAGTASITLPKTITGSHRLYLVLHTTPDASHPYVANIDNVTFVPTKNTTTVLEAEAWKTNSGGALKSETSTWSDGTVVDLGGTYDGAWLDYGTIDFGGTAVTQVATHYVNNSARCGTNSRIDLYLDAFDPAAPGTPYATLPLAPTGADWVKSGTAQLALSKSITGSHRVYLVLHTTADANHPYVANIDKLTFTTGVDKTALRNAIDTTAPLADKTGVYGSIDFAVFLRELAAAKKLLASDTATQSAVDAQARSLSLAASQLTPVSRLTLAHLVSVASAVTNERYTDESWAAFQSALDAGKAVLADSGATDEALQAAAAALSSAQDGLAAKPIVAPAVPMSVTATVSGSSVAVRWTAPAEDGGSPLTGYLVTLDDGHTITISDPTQLSAVFTWLKAGQAYTAQVSALNATGASAPSTAAPATPEAAPAVAESFAALASTPFPSGTITASYPSDSWPATPTGADYNVYILRGFSALGTGTLGANEKVADLSTISAENDKKVIAINHAATSAQVDRAQRDADNSPATTMTDALGSRLGTLYAAAIGAGKLPKTQAILDRVASGLGGADAAKPYFQYLRPYVRMGLASQGGLIYDNKTGGYDGLAGSGSYPSGHTFGGYTFGTTMATLLPELAPLLLARASEYGNNRIILGFHYPLDVMGGRMDAQATVAHRWADPAFADLMLQAHDELEQVLVQECQANGYGDTLAACSGTPYAGLDDAAATDLYTQRLDYGFTKVAATGAQVTVPAEAASLLTTAFPDLTDAQRTQILEQTALDSGDPLDLTAQGDASWERLNLAKALTAQVKLNADGTVTVTNYADATQRSVATASAISVAGTVLDGFDPATRTYVVDWPAGRALPAVTATATADGATVAVAEPLTAGFRSLAAVDDASARSRTVTVTSADGNTSRTYTVAFWITADAHLPGGVVDPGTGGGTDPGNGGTDPGTGTGTGPGTGGGSGTAPAGNGSGSIAGSGSGDLADTGAADLSLAALGALLALALGTAVAVRRRRRQLTR
ncbi:glycoside hydrolase domain-containing protein [Leifsonia aquatica]|uniref:glycoside hydrolase domain-containing protein n=1 Tax=Leifsonia aquatica TaxID=144185 RepID=UPI00384F5B21